MDYSHVWRLMIVAMIVSLLVGCDTAVPVATNDQTYKGIVLPTAILILSPLLTIVSRLAPLIASKKFKQEKAYYSQHTLRD